MCRGVLSGGYRNPSGTTDPLHVLERTSCVVLADEVLDVGTSK